MSENKIQDVEKKKYPMSLSVDAKMHEALRKRASDKGLHISEVVRQLVGHFCIDRDDVKPVIFHIPLSVLSSKETLEDWLEIKSAKLVKQFFPNKE